MTKPTKFVIYAAVSLMGLNIFFGCVNSKNHPNITKSHLEVLARDEVSGEFPKVLNPLYSCIKKSECKIGYNHISTGDGWIYSIDDGGRVRLENHKIGVSLLDEDNKNNLTGIELLDSDNNGSIDYMVLGYRRYEVNKFQHKEKFIKANILFREFKDFYYKEIRQMEAAQNSTLL